MAYYGYCRGVTRKTKICYSHNRDIDKIRAWSVPELFLTTRSGFINTLTAVSRDVAFEPTGCPTQRQSPL